MSVGTEISGAALWMTRLRPGVFCRFMIGHYLWFILVCWLSVTAAITAINVSPEISRVWADQVQAGYLTGLARTSAYIALRVLDNGTQAFPITFLLGVTWAEAAHAHSGRLTMVRTVGMPFLRRTSALLVVAIGSVPLVFVMDNFVRPHAFMTLSVEGLGDYGWSYARKRQPRQEWLAFGDVTMQAVISSGPGPVFTDATLYFFTTEGALERVAEAKYLESSSPGKSDWMMRDAAIWTIGRGEAGELAAPSASTHSHVDVAPAGLSISSTWLKYRGIHPKYVPMADLVALARDTALPDDHPKYREWMVIRSLQCLLPGLTAITLGAIFALALDIAGLAAATVLALFSGYVAYFMARLSAVAAENHILPPVVASLVMPVLLLASFAALLRIIRNRDTLR